VLYFCNIDYFQVKLFEEAPSPLAPQR